MKRNPTPKQRKAAKAVVENLLSKKPLPTGQVLESVGYGSITQDPARILGSEGFQNALEETGLRKALLDKGIDPNKIAEKINVLLEATEPIYRNNNATKQIEFVGEKDDYTAIDKGLKHATAIFGIMPDQPKAPSQITTYNFLFSPEVQGSVREIEDKIKARLIEKHEPNTPTT